MPRDSQPERHRQLHRRGLGNQAEIFRPCGDPLALGSIFGNAAGAKEHYPSPDRKGPTAGVLDDPSPLVTKNQRSFDSWQAAEETRLIRTSHSGGGDTKENPTVPSNRFSYLYQLQIAVAGGGFGSHGSHRDCSWELRSLKRGFGG